MAVSFPFGALSFRFLGDLRQKTRQRTRMRLEYNYINWPRIQKQLDEAGVQLQASKTMPIM